MRIGREEGGVALEGIAALKGRLEESICLRRLGDDEETGGVLVQAVGSTEERVRALVRQERFDRGFVTLTGYREESGRLIDDEECIVLIEDNEPLAEVGEPALVRGRGEVEASEHMAEDRNTAARAGLIEDTFPSHLGTRGCSDPELRHGKRLEAMGESILEELGGAAVAGAGRRGGDLVNG